MSILLLSPPSYPPSPLLTSSNSLSSEASTSSSPTSSSHGHSPESSPATTLHRSTQPRRRIRFAPLPDPRRAVLVTEQGCELPLPQDNETGFSSADLQAALTQSSLDEYLVDLTGNDSDSLYSRSPALIPSTPRSSSPTIASNTPVSFPIQKSKSTPAKSLLRPFPFLHRPRSSTGGSTSSPVGGLMGMGVSTEEILTLGTINLFRSSSRESRRSESELESDSSEKRWGLPLGRWSSAGANAQRPSVEQLARTQSTQSYKGDVRGSNKPKPQPLSKSKSAPSSPKNGNRALNNPSVRKGTRMLNGRIYGAPRLPNSSLHPSHPHYQPFKNARDEAEPEFVEWGYGGMGSVRSSSMVRSASAGAVAPSPSVDWARLHGGSAREDDEGDDGSGMGWVKKRREAREKAAKEKAEREAAAAAAGESTTTTTRTEDEKKESEVKVAVEKLEPAPSLDTTPLATPLAVHNEEHILTAVTLPAALRRTPSSGSRGELTPHREHSEQGLATKADEATADDVAQDESGSDADSDESVDGDDEEEDDSEEEHARKTALSAGVEKISRHKE